jgi:O-acetyl-ADP-ribose deacetylase (regulator of RNase III)
MDMEKKLKDVVIKVIKGDITDLEVEAFVFYARPDLKLGTGFGGAIAVRGGVSIQKELDPVGPLPVTGAVITGAGNLKAKHIIHAVGPRFQEADQEAKLKRTIHSCLRVAEEKGILQVAFPAMGAGFYGIPLEACSKLCVEAVTEYLNGSSKIREVVFCLNDSRELKPFAARVESLQ